MKKDVLKSNGSVLPPIADIDVKRQSDNITEKRFFNPYSGRYVGYNRACQLKRDGHGDLFSLKVNGGDYVVLPGTDYRVVSQGDSILVGSQEGYEQMYRVADIDGEDPPHPTKQFGDDDYPEHYPLLVLPGEKPNNRVKNRTTSGPADFATKGEYDAFALGHGHPDAAHMEDYERRHHIKNEQDLIDEQEAFEQTGLDKHMAGGKQGKQMELFEDSMTAADDYIANGGRTSVEERLANVTVAQATQIIDLQNAVKGKDNELAEWATAKGRMEGELIELGCLTGELNNRVKSFHRIFFAKRTQNDDLPF